MDVAGEETQFVFVCLFVCLEIRGREQKQGTIHGHVRPEDLLQRVRRSVQPDDVDHLEGGQAAVNGSRAGGDA